MDLPPLISNSCHELEMSELEMNELEMSAVYMLLPAAVGESFRYQLWQEKLRK